MALGECASAHPGSPSDHTAVRYRSEFVMMQSLFWGAVSASTATAKASTGWIVSCSGLQTSGWPLESRAGRDTYPFGPHPR